MPNDLITILNRNPEFRDSLYSQIEMKTNYKHRYTCSCGSNILYNSVKDLAYAINNSYHAGDAKIVMAAV